MSSNTISFKRGLAGLLQLSLIFCSSLLFATTDEEKISVVYLGSNHPDFWGKTRLFASEVANDLDINLKFQTGEDRFSKLEAMKKLVNSNDKPDYLIFSYTRNVGSQMMALADKAGIPFILINSDIPKEERRLTNLPREKFSTWLGHIHPNDLEAGYLLADYLVKEARTLTDSRKDKMNPTSPLKVVGIGGPSNHLPAILRNRGLKQRINSDKNASLKRIVTTDWSSSGEAVKTMFKSYNGVDIVWAASDRLAIVAWEAAGRLGYVQGKDFVTGGVDWSPEGLDAVAKRQITVSFGGHIMEAGWALVLIHDYHNKIDFRTDTGTVIKTRFSAANQENIGELQLLFSNNNWSKIDYRQFSKVYTPELQHYRFNAEEMLRLFKSQNALQE